MRKDQSLSTRNHLLYIIGKWQMLKRRRMDLIGRFIGLKKSQGKRMEVSKERCGRRQAGILEIGEIIARKDLVFSFILMEINMRGCGLWTKSTDKVLTGAVKVGN